MNGLLMVLLKFGLCREPVFPQIVKLNYRLNLTFPGLCPAAVASTIRIGTVPGKFLKTPAH
jgi:hypothetical protein